MNRKIAPPIVTRVILMLSVTSILSCSGLTKKSSLSAIIGTKSNGKGSALSFVPVRNKPTVDNVDIGNPGVDYAEDLNRDMPFFALVECEDALEIDASVWLLELEAHALVSDLYIDAERKLLMSNAHSGGFDSNTPCWVIPGSRLVSYPLIDNVLGMVYESKTEPDSNVYLVAQSIYLAMRGFTKKNTEGQVSPLIKKYLEMGQMHWNLNPASVDKVLASLNRMDRDFNPCHSTTGTLGTKSQTWRNQNFGCVSVGEDTWAYSVGGTQGQNFETVRVRIAETIKKAHDSAYADYSASVSPVAKLWDVISRTDKWTEITYNDSAYDLAQYLAGNNPSFLFSSTFHGDKYGDNDASQTLNALDVQGSYGILENLGDTSFSLTLAPVRRYRPARAPRNTIATPNVYQKATPMTQDMLKRFRTHFDTRLESRIKNEPSEFITEVRTRLADQVKTAGTGGKRGVTALGGTMTMEGGIGKSTTDPDYIRFKDANGNYAFMDRTGKVIGLQKISASTVGIPSKADEDVYLLTGRTTRFNTDGTLSLGDYETVKNGEVGLGIKLHGASSDSAMTFPTKANDNGSVNIDLDRGNTKSEMITWYSRVQNGHLEAMEKKCEELTRLKDENSGEKRAMNEPRMTELQAAINQHEKEYQENREKMVGKDGRGGEEGAAVRETLQKTDADLDKRHAKIGCKPKLALFGDCSDQAAEDKGRADNEQLNNQPTNPTTNSSTQDGSTGSLSPSGDGSSGGLGGTTDDGSGSTGGGDAGGVSDVGGGNIGTGADQGEADMGGGGETMGF